MTSDIHLFVFNKKKTIISSLIVIQIFFVILLTQLRKCLNKPIVGLIQYLTVQDNNMSRCAVVLSHLSWRSEEGSCVSSDPPYLFRSSSYKSDSCRKSHQPELLPFSITLDRLIFNLICILVTFGLFHSLNDLYNWSICQVNSPGHGATWSLPTPFTMTQVHASIFIFISFLHFIFWCIFPAPK